MACILHIKSGWFGGIFVHDLPWSSVFEHFLTGQLRATTKLTRDKEAASCLVFEFGKKYCLMSTFRKAAVPFPFLEAAWQRAINVMIYILLTGVLCTEYICSGE